jgi:hypothetical protein
MPSRPLHAADRKDDSLESPAEYGKTVPAAEWEIAHPHPTAPNSTTEDGR